MGICGGKKPKKQTIGYKYYVGMHMVLCNGPIDGVKQIWVGEKCVWPDPEDDTAVAADATDLAEIDASEIFGGEEREGGINGDVDIEYGESAQTKNAYLISQLDPDDERIPTFRGLCAVVLNQVYIGTSAYLKNWSFLGKRTDMLQDGSTQWYPAKADINGDMNPAHIIRECLISSIFGMGLSTVLIDSTYFEDAADTLYDEGFGLSFLWDNDITIENFINEVLRHIDAVLYQDTETGKFVLKLIRDDYDAGSLDVYDDSSIVDVKDFKRDTYANVINQVTVEYSDVSKDKGATVTVQDIAVMDLQGNVIPDNQQYKGVTSAVLANKIATRELRQATSLLARMTIVGNRSMHSIRLGDVFKVTWPILEDVDEMIVRVVKVNYGSLADGAIEFSVVEDVFAASSELYATPPDTEWDDPISYPEDITDYIFDEVPYWTLVIRLGESLAELLDSDASYIGAAVKKPSNDSLDYELYIRDDPALDYVSAGRGDFTPNATLDANLLLNASDATIDLNDVDNLTSVEANTFAIIGTEIVKVKSVDAALNRVTIARGVLDTVPDSHLSGDIIWFAETSSSLVEKEYTVTEQPSIKILPSTGKGRLALVDATAHSPSAMNSRQTRPYPPGNFKINAVSYPASFSGQPTLTWSHRNRLTQTVSIIEHSYGNIGPEAGTTYTLKIYDENDVLVRTETGLSGTTYTYTEEDEMADCGLGSGDPLNSQLRFVLYSVRDGYDSWQSYDITVTRS